MDEGTKVTNYACPGIGKGLTESDVDPQFTSISLGTRRSLLERGCVDK